MPVAKAAAEGGTPTKEEVQQLRMQYYFQFQGVLTPWYYLAAVDQYERNIQDVRIDIPKRESIIAIQFSDEYWSGILNPMENDTSPHAIDYFGGMGLDGNDDGVADKTDDEDVLFSMAKYLSAYGYGEDQFKLALWEYYKNELTVKQIMVIANVYEKFGTIDLNAHTFPVAIGYEYSYRGTWGANRGWGGNRIHEGTDIFAGYGTPILSASYGVIEVMGWNQFGGWRIGVRDNHNSYHYYAHLGYFEEGLQEGDIVETGQVIGYVGSSGYGKEGTAGKFPPHLHYGIYKFNGRTEWAFDPYPSLLQWEKEARSAKKR
ncbi:peptidase M23 [Lysinibacillus sp. 2017]|uniref:M23 family metallopeptidase n=1 Tax=unclassified Lysinibacillus TaxID=2636778 RepID=UPI000D528CDE|nr:MULTISPECIES: M23 family metallopeptidase [unclassified Lysinibacillus]AWE09283.1 peptidase M23 [Lysinibacillus sp. 2017]TGN33170.1 M23 family metallopeptidase [Lysinibacillus sp. S2017]